MAIGRVLGEFPEPDMSIKRVDCKCCNGSGKVSECPRCRNTGFEGVCLDGGGFASKACENGCQAPIPQF